MAEIAFFAEPQEKWFPYDEDTEVLILLLSKKELRQLAVKASKFGKEAAAAGDRILGRMAVKGWRKIGDPSHPGFTHRGEPFPCTPENIDALMTHSIEFSRFVNDKASSEREFVEVEDSKND